MVSQSFIELWEPMYKNWKYPEDFYRSHMDGARDANNHEQLIYSLIALLNWKDGKAQKFQTDGKNHAKPNIIRPILGAPKKSSGTAVKGEQAGQPQARGLNVNHHQATTCPKRSGRNLRFIADCKESRADALCHKDLGVFH